MNDVQLKALAMYHLAQMRIAELTERARDDERGELGSWMILAAGLAVAAGAAVAALTPWFTTKVTEITGN